MTSPTPSNPITVDEVKATAERFWRIVQGGGPGREAAPIFAAGGLIAPDGTWLDLEAHQALHRDLRDESHHWESIELEALCDDPPRVFVVASVGWRATIRATDERIDAVVGQRWLLERRPDGSLRFNGWWSNSIEYRPGSAVPGGLRPRR